MSGGGTLSRPHRCIHFLGPEERTAVFCASQFLVRSWGQVGGPVSAGGLSARGKMFSSAFSLTHRC